MKRPFSQLLGYGLITAVVVVAALQYHYDRMSLSGLLVVLLIALILYLCLQQLFAPPQRLYRVEEHGYQDYMLVCVDEPYASVAAHPDHFKPGEWVREGDIEIREEEIHNLHLPGGSMRLRIAYRRRPRRPAPTILKELP